MLTLTRALVDYDIDILHVIARQWDIDLVAKERAAAADELAVSMLQGEAAAAIWERLPEEARQALVDLMVNQGELLYSHFTRRYGELRPMGPARREREKPWLSTENITEYLYYRGLIVRTFQQTPAGAQEYIGIPIDLLELLPQPSRESVRSAPGFAVAPPRRLMAGQDIAPDDLATLIAYLLLREDNARPWLEPTSVDGIDLYLRRPNNPAYRAFLTHLAYELGQISDQVVLTHVVTEVDKDAVRPWLEAPRQHQLRSLAETWLRSSAWNALAYTPGLEADEWPNDPRLARQTALDALQDVPAEIWWSLEGFVEAIKQHNPDFQRPGGDYSAWYLRDTYTGEIMHGFQYWDHIEGALLRFIIEGPMNWLGLVYAERGAFMLTPLGLALLGRADWPSEPDPKAHIQVDEQGVIAVPPEVSRYHRVQIARFSSWLNSPGIPEHSAWKHHHGQAYLYRLTAQSIERTAAEGLTLSSHIIPFLQRLSGRDLPLNVVKMLQAWEETPEEVVIQDVVILVAKNLKVQERLQSNDRINRWLVQQVGPRAYAVRRENMPALMNALRETGILPLFEGHAKDDRP